MTREQALAYLHRAGENSASDYDDGADGYVGWRVADGVLTFSAELYDPGADEMKPPVTFSWALAPA